ncbi:putative immunity/bacteriocin fusion bifunctional protein [Virgibacillus natechei]|uniref:putative immunity/bacteriocin fusion bifunctional protein n=1 Tax=Virgibacillus sp. CBA3643 TaxID=2942278 RepID=UPI0035A276D5
MKKFFFLLVSVVLVVLNTGFSTSAMNDIEANVLEKMSNQQLELFKEFKDNGGEISILTEDEIKKIESVVMGEKELQNFHDNQLKGYEKVSLTPEASSFKISDDNGTNYLHFQAYEQNNSYIMAVSVYDAEKDKINSFTGERKVINEETNEVSDTEELIQYTGSDGDVSTQDWEWNGKTFACGMAGVLACIQYCGVWTIVHPGAGAACDIVCNTAMVIACM